MARTISYALVAAGIAVSTPVVVASPAAADGCLLDNANHLYGRTVNLWNCAGRGHGQIVNGSPGDSVEMRYFSVKVHGYVSAGRTVVPPGSTTANSGELLPGLMLAPQACIQFIDHPGSACAA